MVELANDTHEVNFVIISVWLGGRLMDNVLKSEEYQRSNKQEEQEHGDEQQNDEIV